MSVILDGTNMRNNLLCPIKALPTVSRTYLLTTYYLLKNKPSDPLIKEIFVIFPDILRDDHNIFNNLNMCIYEYVDKSALRKCLKSHLKSLSTSHPDLIFWGKRDALLTNPDLIAQVFHSVYSF